MESVVSDKAASHKYHIFILMSYTAYSACCCYLYIYHSNLSDYDLQIDVRNGEHITIV